tara:strand:+ start:155 stop:511 length:357 start_codon:yes stop_codon:yes gene_type:complete
VGSGDQRLNVQLKPDRDRRELLLLLTLEKPLFDLEIMIDEFGREFQLTPREAEVLFCLAMGKTNPEIATITDSAVRTVEAHLRQVYPKIEVENRQAAAVFVPDHFRSKKRDLHESGTG